MMPFWQDSGILTDTQLIVDEPKNTSYFLVFKIINKTVLSFLQVCIACFRCYMLFYVILRYLHFDVRCCSVFDW